jgi:hypothetical protein
MLTTTHPITLDYALTAYLTIYFQVCSKDTTNCTQWHTSSQLVPMLSGNI